MIESNMTLCTIFVFSIVTVACFKMTETVCSCNITIHIIEFTGFFLSQLNIYIIDLSSVNFFKLMKQPKKVIKIMIQFDAEMSSSTPFTWHLGMRTAF